MPDKTVTVGPGKTYASLQAAITGEVAANADLVAMGGILNIVLYAFTDTTPATVTGFTVDATHYVNIYTDLSARHAGVWDGDKYTLAISSNNTCLTINNSYTRLQGVQIVFQVTDEGTGGDLIDVLQDHATINGNILKSETNQTYAFWCDAIFVGDGSGGAARIYNNLIYGIRFAAPRAAAIGINDPTMSYVYNNTIVNCDYGFYNSGTGCVAKNNLISGCGGAPFDGSANSGSGYNATDSASWGDYPGYTGDRLNQTFTFVAPGLSNFLITASDTGAYQYGVNLRADANCPFFIDITETPRQNPWSIGADQPQLNPAFMLLVIR
jgi:hypothetical protein